MKYLESNIIITISIAISVIALIVAANSFPIMFDTYWHLATGRDYLNFGDSPFRDHFSFTHYGENIGSPAIFQIIIAYYTSIFGLTNGYFLFKLTVYILFLITVYFFYRSNNISKSGIVATLPFIIFFFLQRGINVRPEIISYILLMICLILYFRTIKDFNSKNLALVSLLLIAWGNYHTPVIGYIIIFGLFLEKGIYKLKGEELFSWGYYSSWGLIIFLTGYANPKLSHFFFSQMNFSTEWKIYISEYQSIVLSYSPPFITILIGLSILLFIWLFHTKKYGILFICILLLTQTWYMVRLISFTGIIISCSYSIFISEFIRLYNIADSCKYKPIRGRQYGIAVITIIAIFGHLYLIYNSYKINQTRSRADNYFPVETVNYLKQSRDSGNIFNPFHVGGYLSYYLPKKFKTYIDGRTNILFSLEFYKNYLHLLHYPLKLVEEVNKYNIDYTLLQNHPFNFELIDRTKILTVDYVDQQYFLSKTGIGNFQVSGNILMRPACWKYVMTPTLLTEIDKGKRILPLTSPLREILVYMEAYSQSSDKHIFFQKIISNKTDSDYTKRTLAFLALDQGYLNDSILLFHDIVEKFPTDIMAMAIGFIQQQDYNSAYNLLSSSFFPISTKNKLTSSERQMLLKLFKFLSESIEIKIDEALLSEFMNINSLKSETLQSELCETHILPTIKDY